LHLARIDYVAEEENSRETIAETQSFATTVAYSLLNFLLNRVNGGLDA